jgi:hypothetical protein
MARLGSMPKGAKFRYKICTLYGDDLPYIIRPYGDGIYTLIGDFYAHGSIYGEAMDMENITTETIHLV